MFKITKAQVLHILGSVVFVPVSIVASAWLTKHFPGMPHFSASDIAHEELVVAAGAFGTALHYLHGWQWWERHVAPVVDVTGATAPGAPPVAGPPAP